MLLDLPEPILLVTCRQEGFEPQYYGFGERYSATCPLNTHMCPDPGTPSFPQLQSLIPNICGSSPPPLLLLSLCIVPLPVLALNHAEARQGHSSPGGRWCSTNRGPPAFSSSSHVELCTHICFSPTHFALLSLWVEVPFWDAIYVKRTKKRLRLMWNKMLVTRIYSTPLCFINSPLSLNFKFFLQSPLSTQSFLVIRFSFFPFYSCSLTHFSVPIKITLAPSSCTLISFVTNLAVSCSFVKSIIRFK